MAEMLEYVGGTASGEVSDVRGFLERLWGSFTRIRVSVTRVEPTIFPARPTLGVTQVNCGGFLEERREVFSTEDLAASWGGGTFRLDVHAGTGAETQKIDSCLVHIGGDPTHYPHGGQPVPVPTPGSGIAGAFLQSAVGQAENAQVMQVRQSYEATLKSYQEQNLALASQVKTLMESSDSRASAAKEPYRDSLTMMQQIHEREVSGLRAELERQRDDARHREQAVRDTLKAQYEPDISRLRDEVQKLQREVFEREQRARSEAGAASGVTIDLLRGTLEQLRADNDALRREAERLRTAQNEKTDPLGQLESLQKLMHHPLLSPPAPAQPEMSFLEKLAPALPMLEKAGMGIFGSIQKKMAIDRERLEVEKKNAEALHAVAAAQSRALPAPTQAPAFTPPPASTPVVPSPPPVVQGKVPETIEELVAHLDRALDQGLTPDQAVAPLISAPEIADIKEAVKSLSPDVIRGELDKAVAENLHPTAALRSPAGNAFLTKCLEVFSR